MWAVIIIAIESLPKVDGGLLSTIETLIISSLRSRHKAILNQSILLWNRTFGSVDVLEYPNALRPVLLRLRTLTDLDLPNFTVDDDTEVCLLHPSCINSVRLTAYKEMSSPIVFINSQPDEDIPAPQYSTPIKPASYIAYTGKESPGRSKQAAGILKRSPWSPASKPGLNTTPKVRLRHDDSQIQFAAIDSSPLQPDEVESQILTDRQKEVRQRQILEATTMFPHLGQVPGSTDHVSNRKMPKLNFAENGTSNSPILSGNEVTSSPAQDLLADVIGFSPTPRSRIERFRRRPVFQQLSISPVVRIGSSPDTHISSGSDGPTEPQAGTTEQEDDANLFDRDMPMSNNDSFPLLSEHVGDMLDSFGAPMDQPRTPTRKSVPVKEPIKEAVDLSSLSDVEVFVDARPDSPQATDDIAHNRVSGVRASDVPPQASRPFNEATTDDALPSPTNPMTHSETPMVTQDPDIFAEAPHSPNDDEQIAAQLVNDLERASSQAENEMRGNLTWTASPRVNAKKRKSAPGESESDWKKKRRRTQQSQERQNIQIVVDSRRAVKAGAEYVDVGANDLLPAPSRAGKLKKIELPAKGAKGVKGTQKRTVVALHGLSRVARSSSASASTDYDSCGTSDATRLSAMDVKRERADHHPVAERRRSARLNGRPASSSALHGSDGAPMSSDEFGEFSDADILQGISVKAEQASEDHDSTPQQQTGDAGQGLHGDVQPEAAASTQEIPVGVNGSDDLLEERNVVGPQGILQNLRKLLENIKRVTFGVEEEREIVSVLVDSVREVHEAGRRHGKTAPSV